MKNAALQMLEMWLSKERLLSNSTPRFLTDGEELTERPSSVGQCSMLLLVGVLGPIINTCFFLNLAVRNDSSSTFFISTMHSVSFSIWCVPKKYRAEYHQPNPVFSDDISQG